MGEVADVVIQPWKVSWFLSFVEILSSVTGSWSIFAIADEVLDSNGFLILLSSTVGSDPTAMSNMSCLLSSIATSGFVSTKSIDITLYAAQNLLRKVCQTVENSYVQRPRKILPSVTLYAWA